jgi:hypothetical protein
MIARKLASSCLAAALAVSVFAAPTVAAPRAGQAAIGNLIAALVNVQTGDIVVVDASNVLRNADIDVLNNALNNLNVEILNDAEILNNVEVSNILNDLNVNVEDVVVAVNALGGTVIFLP